MAKEMEAGMGWIGDNDNTLAVEGFTIEEISRGTGLSEEVLLQRIAAALFKRDDTFPTKIGTE